MRFDLIALLAERTFSHPSRIIEAVMAGDTLRLSIEGRPWWTSNPDKPNTTYTLTFSGLDCGLFDLSTLPNPDDDEALGELYVGRVTDIPWAQPTAATIYCSQPIPEPLKIYALVESWVETSDGVLSVRNILNGAHRLSTFLDFSSSNFFLLGSAPEGLLTILVAELDRQRVRHQLHRFTAYTARDARYFVRLEGDTWFFCDSAVLETRES